MIGLTPKMEKARAFIAAEVARGQWPTCRAIAQALGATSSKVGHAMLHVLMERGHVYRHLTPEEAKAGEPGCFFLAEPPCARINRARYAAENAEAA